VSFAISEIGLAKFVSDGAYCLIFLLVRRLVLWSDQIAPQTELSSILRKRRGGGEMLLYLGRIEVSDFT
jgi:hypothetical protein